jgi:hypothetical protein
MIVAHWDSPGFAMLFVKLAGNHLAIEAIFPVLAMLLEPICHFLECSALI